MKSKMETKTIKKVTTRKRYDYTIGNEKLSWLDSEELVKLPNYINIKQIDELIFILKDLKRESEKKR